MGLVEDQERQIQLQPLQPPTPQFGDFRSESGSDSLDPGVDGRTGMERKVTLEDASEVSQIQLRKDFENGCGDRVVAEVGAIELVEFLAPTTSRRREQGLDSVLPEAERLEPLDHSLRPARERSTL